MADTGSIAEDTRQEELIPTIIIGLGGTGKVALARLKARFYQRFNGRLPATVRLLCLDIDPKEELGRVDGQMVKLGTEEFLDLGNVNVSDIKRELAANHFPEIDAWFDRKIALAESNLRKGAQQNRQLGRLALFWRLEEVKQALTNAIGHVTRLGLTAEAGRPDTARPVEVNVFIISSICGGTGSGMLIDVAYVIKDLFERRGMGDLVSVIGVLVSPLVFRTANQDNIQPNAFAALQELDYFMTRRAEKTAKRLGEPAQINYPSGYQVDCHERPFKICYLIDAVASSGRALEGIENLAPMLIDGIFLQVGSRLGASAASLINNVKSLNAPERRTVYSSFGVASLIFPAGQIIDICADRVAREVLTEGLLREPLEAVKQDLAIQVNRFLDDKEFDQMRLLQRLRQKDNKPLIGRLKEDDRLRDNRLRKVDKEQMFVHVTGRVEDLSSEAGAITARHLDLQQQTIIADFLQLPKEGRKTLAGRVQEITNDRQLGLPHAIIFLTRLRSRLEEIWEDLGRSSNTAQGDRTKTQQRRQVAQEAFERDHKAALKPLSFRNSEKAREEYIGAAQTYLDRELEYNSLARARQVVSTLMNSAADLLERLNLLRDNLTWAADSYLQEHENLARRALMGLDVVRRKPIIDPVKDLDGLYNHFHADARFRTLGDLQGMERGLWGLVGQRREAIAELVFGLAQKAFEPISQIRLEDVILEKAGITEPDKRRVLPRNLLLAETEKYEPARWLETLRANADFFWNYNEAMERGRDQNAERIMITGVRDTQNTIFANIATKQGEGLASTDDPQLMTVLQMIHGFMFDSMSQYRTYQESYKRSRRRGDAVYVFPEFNLGDNDTRRLFIRAHAYGTLFAKEAKGRGLIAWNWEGNEGQYVIIPAADGDKPVILGDGTLKEALRHFARQPALQAKVLERVEAVERSMRPQKAEFVTQIEKFAKEFPGQLDADEQQMWGEELLTLLGAFTRDFVIKP
ncbi:MAG: hypothetical protein NT169_21365 [Chloroflexi bacterium]|nr:hypothetical protein [Chloroflexota bacterium]